LQKARRNRIATQSIVLIRDFGEEKILHAFSRYTEHIYSEHKLLQLVCHTAKNMFSYAVPAGNCMEQIHLNLTVPQLFKKLLGFYGTGMFTAVFPGELLPVALSCVPSFCATSNYFCSQESSK
jgi:hypothetical protein